MGFPVVQQIVEGQHASATSHNVAMPTTVLAGEILLVMLTQDCSSLQTMGTPAGWTKIYDQANGGTWIRICGYVKVAVGDEDGTTVDFTSSAASLVNSQTWRISGTFEGALTDVEDGTVTGSTDASPNPPSLTPSWGNQDALWIAALGMRNQLQGAVTGYPANFTDNNEQTPWTGGSTVSVAACSRNLKASSLDPGTYTIGSSADWLTNTIAIRGAAGGGSGGGGGQGGGGRGNGGNGGGGGNPGGGPPGQSGGNNDTRYFLSGLRKRRRQFAGF